jgi:uncharacterized protein with GYD domain
MAHYLVQNSYSTQGASDLVRNPHDREAAVRPAIERLGGKVEKVYCAFGEYDIVFIVEMPDNTSMAALSMAVGASGAAASFKTTVLIPMDEAVEAMRKAGAVGYRPPGG